MGISVAKGIFFFSAAKSHQNSNSYYSWQHAYFPFVDKFPNEKFKLDSRVRLEKSSSEPIPPPPLPHSTRVGAVKVAAAYLKLVDCHPRVGGKALQHGHEELEAA